MLSSFDEAECPESPSSGIRSSSDFTFSGYRYRLCGMKRRFSFLSIVLSVFAFSSCSFYFGGGVSGAVASKTEMKPFSSLGNPILLVTPVSDRKYLLGLENSGSWCSYSAGTVVMVYNPASETVYDWAFTESRQSEWVHEFHALSGGKEYVGFYERGYSNRQAEFKFLSAETGKFTSSLTDGKFYYWTLSGNSAIAEFIPENGGRRLVCLELGGGSSGKPVEVELDISDFSHDDIVPDGEGSFFLVDKNSESEPAYQLVELRNGKILSRTPIKEQSGGTGYRVFAANRDSVILRFYSGGSDYDGYMSLLVLDRSDIAAGGKTVSGEQIYKDGFSADEIFFSGDGIYLTCRRWRKNGGEADIRICRLELDGGKTAYTGTEFVCESTSFCGVFPDGEKCRFVAAASDDGHRSNRIFYIYEFNVNGSGTVGRTEIKFADVVPEVD